MKPSILRHFTRIVCHDCSCGRESAAKHLTPLRAGTGLRLPCTQKSSHPKPDKTPPKKIAPCGSTTSDEQGRAPSGFASRTSHPRTSAQSAVENSFVCSLPSAYFRHA